MQLTHYNLPQEWKDASLKRIGHIVSLHINQYHACWRQRGTLSREEENDPEAWELGIRFYVEAYTDGVQGWISRTYKEGYQALVLAQELSRRTFFGQPQFHRWVTTRRLDYPGIIDFFDAVNYARLHALRHLQAFDGIDIQAHQREALTHVDAKVAQSCDRSHLQWHLAAFAMQAQRKKVTGPTISALTPPTLTESEALRLNDYADPLIWHQIFEKASLHGKHTQKKSLWHPFERLDYTLLLCGEYQYRYDPVEKISS